MQVVIESVLWKYHQLKNGGFTVKIRITNYRNTEYVSTEMSCRQLDWDDENYCPRPSHPEYGKLTQKIKEIRDEIDFELRLAKKNGESITIKEIKRRVEKKPEKPTNSPAKIKILAFYDLIIKELEEQSRIGYANVFSHNKEVISKVVLNGKDKYFEDMTEENFLKLESYIHTLKSESTKSNYLRTFYSLWNMAIKRKHCSKDFHPKDFIGFKAYKRIKTKKRAIPFDYIKKLEELEYDYSSRYFRSQQYALFSYYCRGMNFSDMAKLKWAIHIQKEQLTYKRSKNKRSYSFAIHPKALVIVEIFRNYPMQSEAGYVFPILDKFHDTPRRIATRINTALKDFNEDLLVFEKAIDAPRHLTSYVLRHSFATNLRQKRVDISIIKEAMGHETEFQTNTYLEDIDDSIVATAINEALA